MAANDNLKALRVALVVIGVFLVVGLYPLTIVWPSGWLWHAGSHDPYFHTLLGAYATVGVFLVVAAGRPLENLSFIKFVAVAAFVQGAIMLIHVVTYWPLRGHLFGDVPAAFLIGAVLAILLRQLPAGAATG